MNPTASHAHKWQSGKCDLCGIAIDERDSNGMTRLTVAAYKGEREVCENLLTGGADVNATNRDDIKALMLAAQQGRLEIVRILLAAGGDVRARSNVGNTALMLAANGGYAEIVKVLIDAGSDVNAADVDDMSVLNAAVQKCGPDIVSLLLEKGADPHARPKGKGDALGNAILSGRIENARLLLAHGAILEWDADMLVMVAGNGDLDTMRLLLDQGADINVSERQYHLTPLSAAAAYGKLEMVKLLVETGADLTAKDRRGNTALGLAEMKRQTATAAYLRSRTGSAPPSSMPTLQELSASGLGGRKLREIHLAPSTNYRVRIRLAMGRGTSMSQNMTFQTNTSGGIVEISDPLTTRDMLLMDYELLALEDQTHGLSIGDFCDRV